METNGHQNYLNWEQMRGAHPYPNAGWAQTKGGVFKIDEDYFAKSGGILETPEPYLKMVQPK